jgi:hypothetical protein
MSYDFYQIIYQIKAENHPKNTCCHPIAKLASHCFDNKDDKKTLVKVSPAPSWSWAGPSDVVSLPPINGNAKSL